jgi:hypothetical protein
MLANAIKISSRVGGAAGVSADTADGFGWGGAGGGDVIAFV